MGFGRDLEICGWTVLEPDCGENEKASNYLHWVLRETETLPSSLASQLPLAPVRWASRPSATSAQNHKDKPQTITRLRPDLTCSACRLTSLVDDGLTLSDFPWLCSGLKTDRKVEPWRTTSVLSAIQAQIRVHVFCLCTSKKVLKWHYRDASVDQLDSKDSQPSHHVFVTRTHTPPSGSLFEDLRRSGIGARVGHSTVERPD